WRTSPASLRCARSRPARAPWSAGGESQRAASATSRGPHSVLGATKAAGCHELLRGGPLGLAGLPGHRAMTHVAAVFNPRDTQLGTGARSHQDPILRSGPAPTLAAVGHNS